MYTITLILLALVFFFEQTGVGVEQGSTRQVKCGCVTGWLKYFSLPRFF